jgi:hypothetical protein
VRRLAKLTKRNLQIGFGLSGNLIFCLAQVSLTPLIHAYPPIERATRQPDGSFGHNKRANATASYWRHANAFLNEMTNKIDTVIDNTVEPKDPSQTASAKLVGMVGSSLPYKAVAPIKAVGLHLGVNGIDPELSQMVIGGLYAIKVTTPSTRFALLATSLRTAMSAGVHCTLITNSAPDEVLSRLAQCNSFPAHDLVKQKRLSVFSMQDEFSKKLFRFGADRFVQEIENFEIPSNSFIVFEQADEVLSLHDLWLASQQIKVLSQWFKRRQTTGLMAFTRSNAQQSAALNALMDNLSGLAQLGADKAGLELTFLYWQSPNGVMAARNFNLRSHVDGGYEVVDQAQVGELLARAQNIPHSTLSPLQEIGPLEQDNSLGSNPKLSATNFANGPVSSEMARQIATQISAQLASVRNAIAETSELSDGDTLDQEIQGRKKAARGATYFFIHNDPEFDRLSNQMPGKFYFAQSLADILQNALLRPNAMILLAIHADQDVSTAGNAIHTIRKNLGGLTKIVVRERSGSLSDAEHKLLLLCGVNECIRNEVPISNIPARLLELYDKPSNMVVDANFDAIFSSISTQLGNTGPLAEVLEPGLPSTFAIGSMDHQTKAPAAQRVIEKAKRSAMRVAR